jgi:hypothetical protein
MTETFYGPWELITQQTNFGDKWAFRVHGSDNADGLFEADTTQPWNLRVQGAEWTVELVFLDGDGQWQPAPNVVRTTGIAQPAGLTVTLDSHAPLHLDCVSMDPAINPPMRKNPYDFTVSGG